MSNKVVGAIVEHSGLPKDFAKEGLEDLLFRSGFDPSNAGLDEIREVLADLLQTLILEAETEK